jgi:TPR repeat protein
MYDEGRGAAKDPARAIAWYGKAAAQGLAPAELAMGTFYANGETVKRDPVAAAKWFFLAGSHGEPEAEAFYEAVAREMTVAQKAEAMRQADAALTKLQEK